MRKAAPAARGRLPGAPPLCASPLGVRCTAPPPLSHSCTKPSRRALKEPSCGNQRDKNTIEPQLL
jgi:hypothetical protein